MDGAEITNLTVRGQPFSLSIRGSGSRIKSFTINGKALDKKAKKPN